MLARVESANPDTEAQYYVCRTRANNLRQNISRGFTPANTFEQSVRDCFGRIKMRTRNLAESQNKGDENAACSYGISEQSDGDVSAPGAVQP
jgi:hypothetical protein